MCQCKHHCIRHPLPPFFGSLKCFIEGETRVWWRPLQATPGIAQRKETTYLSPEEDLWRHQAVKRGTFSSGPLHLLFFSMPRENGGEMTTSWCCLILIFSPHLKVDLIHVQTHRHNRTKCRCACLVDRLLWTCWLSLMLPQTASLDLLYGLLEFRWCGC